VSGNIGGIGLSKAEIIASVVGQLLEGCGQGVVLGLEEAWA
jgi:hypothetical protein